MPDRAYALLSLLGATAAIRYRPVQNRTSGYGTDRVTDELLAIVNEIDTLIGKRKSDTNKAGTIPELVRAKEKIVSAIAVVGGSREARTGK